MAIIPYDRITNLQNDQALAPTDPYPAQKLDQEYNAIKITTDDIIQHLDIIQRDDGQLENDSVGLDQLRDEIIIGFNAPAPWVTDHDYLHGDSVFQDNGFWFCLVDHHSTVFADNVIAGYWSLIADFSTVATTGAPMYVSDGPPALPQQGVQWYESDTGNTYLYYIEPGDTVGQWIQTNGSSVASGVVSGGGEIRVEDYGADPSAPAATNSAAFDSALAAAIARGGATINIGPGTFNLNANWSIASITGASVRITGASTASATSLHFSGGFGIVCLADGVQIQNLTINTSGNGIVIGDGSVNNYSTSIMAVSFTNCAVGINVHDGANTRILNCDFVEYTNSGIQIATALNPDAGDCLIDGCWFNTNGGLAGGSSNAAIFHLGGGGWKVSNCKMVGGNVGFSHRAIYSATCTSLIITDCSIEGMNAAAIAISNSSTTQGDLLNVLIDGIQGGGHLYGIIIEAPGGRSWVHHLLIANVILATVTGGTAILIDGVDDLTIGGTSTLNNINLGGPSAVGIAIGANTSGTITIPTIVGYTTRYTNASVNVNVVDPVYAAPFDALAYNGMQINGSMGVSQENGASAVAIGAGTVSTKYIVDGVYVFKTGTNAFTAQQAASVFLGYNSELKVTVTTAQPTIGSDSIQLRVPIEGYRFKRAGWGTAAAVPITIGFWLKSSVASAGEFLVQILDGTNSAYFTTVFAVNTAKWITGTFMPPVAWTGSTTNGVGGFITFYLMGNAFNIAATVGNTFEITGLVILPGIVAPPEVRAPLIMRPYDQELALCMRYLESFYNSTSFNYFTFFQGQASGATTADFPTIWRVPKCATPSISVSSPAHFRVLRIGLTTPVGSTPTGFSFWGVNIDTGMIRATHSGSPLTQGELLGLAADGTSPAKILIDARL